MTAQSRAFDEWLDGVMDGEKPTADSFAATALNDLPRVTTHVRPPNFRAWGFKSQAAMDAAFSEDLT